ncbi:hypothetical protein [Roseofilum capinflatum]|uniref:Uncharacterized protein n=1 Tax=Roseofilum capinflatum BLCC-M114 TaxID=3022440 RepID=A0ABT7B447_9CYAN|nr:hypothetical protein [Roseofilum capinflatum]MDJ1173952.1 hypothetical protein [Roseofilum capinflatum BLCC-M114]
MSDKRLPLIPLPPSPAGEGESPSPVGEGFRERDFPIEQLI